MAVSPLRVSRRPKGSPRRKSLTAAAQLITDPQRQLKRAGFSATREDWQQEAWDFYDGNNAVGELTYYVSWRSNSSSRCRFVASEIDPETGMPTGGLEADENGNPIGDGKRVAEYVRLLAGGPMGQSELVKRAVESLSVPGEVYICVLIRKDGGTDANGDDTASENWYAITREEYKTKTGGVAEITLPDGTKHDFNPAKDSMVRVWNPRARKAHEATSPVRGVLDPLREIVRTSKKIRNAAKSRLINNGVLFLPEQMSLPSAATPIPEDQVQLPGAPTPVVLGVQAADQLATMLYQAGVATTDDEDSQMAFIPLMATVPGEYLEKVQHLKFDNDITDVEIKTRTDAITRLAMGLDVSPERLLGIGSNANHWSAWQIGDEDVQLHIKPVMDLICKAIWDAILKPVLKRENIDVDKYILWYDASGLTADPDVTDEAIKAHEVGAIRSDALRRLLNVGEDNGYDLTTLEGCQEFARDAITKDPTLIAQYWSVISAGVPELEAIEIPQPVAALPPGQDDQNDDETDDEDPPDTEDDSKDSKASAAVVISGRAEYILAERMLVTRCLELAGKRRFSTGNRDQKERLRGIAAHNYHRFMPPVEESEIPRLIKGWDSALEDDVIARLGIDTEGLRESVRRIVRRELTRPLVDAQVVG